jgi:hypothetical protein
VADELTSTAGHRVTDDRGKPDFVVIGAQKSASTFLQDQMAQHPEVEIAEGEVRCFEDPYYSQDAVDALPTLFSSPAGSHTLRGIKRPDLLGRPEVPARLHRHLPDAKLFAVVREPVARAVSAYYHYVRHGFLPLLSIDDAFEALLQGALVADHPRSAEVLEFGRYGAHLQRYQDHYSPEQIMVFEQKQLTGDPARQLHTAFEFIGVDPGFVPTTTSAVSNRGVYAPFRLRLLRTKNRFVYTYTPSLDRRYPRRPTPLGWTYNAAVVALDRLVLSRFDEGRPAELSPDLRARVAAFYDEDRDLLRRLLADTPAAGAGWL